MVYRLRLMGPFELLSADGRSIPVAAKKSQALLAMLALAGGAPVPRSRLTAVFWGDRGEDQARNSLRQALAGLRKLFPEDRASPLRITEDSAAIDLAVLATDIAASDGALGSGEFLEGLHIPGQPAQEWLTAERARLAALHAERLAARIARLGAEGDAAGAVRVAQALVQADPLSEAAHRALMRGYAASGDRPRALKQFRACRDTLKAELGVEPDAETIRLAEGIRAGGARPAPPPTPAAAVPHSAPPVVAVLPFANLSADPEQEYFSDGITDDIITELGRFRTLNVIARTSAFHFKGRAPLAAELREALGADFAVQGSIRKAGNRVRVTAQLSDTASGRQLWAEHFDRDLTDIFAVQDEITDTVAGLVHGRLESAGQQRVLRVPPEGLGAYDLCLRAKALIRKFRPKENAEARALLCRAIELDPQCALAHAMLATTHQLDWISFWVEDRVRAREEAFVHARRAVELDRDDSHARYRLAEALQYRGEFAEARTQFLDGLRLNPNDVDLRGMYGFFLSCLGEAEEAMGHFAHAARLDPFDSYMLPWLHGAACYNVGRYEDAIAQLSRISDPLAEVYGWLAAANGQLGRMREARRLVSLFLDAAEAEMAAFPGRRIEDWKAHCLNDIGLGPPETGLHFYEGLAKAWPE